MARQFPVWTRQEDDDLARRYNFEDIQILCAALGRTVDAIRSRAAVLGITPPIDHGDREGARSEAVRGNQNFINAMDRAIRAGLERPDRVGIDTRPCTRAPKFIDLGHKF